MESETKPNKAQYENGQKEPLDPAKIAPTYLQWQVNFGVNDYRRK
jgi:hypothetical protein